MAQDSLIDDVFKHFAAVLNNKRPPSERKLEKQRAMFLEGYIKFAEIFAESELGNMEVDIAKLALYVFSPEFVYHTTYKIENIEDVYKMIEEDILNGMPIWRYFKCSDWTLSMLEKQFKNDIDEEEKRIKEKYICKRCKHFKEDYKDLGHYSVCKSRQRQIEKGRDYHDYKKIKTCKYFNSESENSIMDKYNK